MVRGEYKYSLSLYATETGISSGLIGHRFYLLWRRHVGALQKGNNMAAGKSPNMRH